MDGRGRIAEPVTGGGQPRGAAGVSPAGRRMRRRPAPGMSRLEFALLRWQDAILGYRPPRGAGIAAALLLLAGSAAYGAFQGGHGPALAGQLAAVRDGIANAAGFRIDSIALAGGKEVTREEILTLAGVTGRTSLLFLDASGARKRLKDNPWIAEATVLKLYPGRLRIDVTERKAFALWQKDGKVSVVAGDGTVLQSFVAPRFARLPLVVGAGAQVKARDFLALLDRHPVLRDQVQASVLVAERRWNVMLRNGIEVMLPEQDAERALDVLARLDRDKKLLTRDIKAVDLRLDDRVTIRLSDEAAAARAEALRAKPRRRGGDA